ncbi:uncharacterized protein LOC124286266 [Haliotis rubra]|uniref:uncharacterized protein LOC124286266 n=1 Tax=Haliotis rubra TaxID=36100 RepID=UPI001EE53A2F|nr:uncharacterized protein LOC124286266 [Haliotis rubra]
MALRNFFDSKILALSVLVLLIATLVSVLCALLPFWFRLHFDAADATYGSMGEREAELQIGVFWMYKPNKPGPERTKVLMTSLVALGEATNLQVEPGWFKAGQVFYCIGVFGIAAGFGGSAILALREFGSLTGSLGLSVFTLIAAISQVIAVVFLLITSISGKSTWHMLPLEDPYRVVITSYPEMNLDWGFYVAVIGAGLSIFGAVLLIIESLKLCKSIEDIRRRQLTTKPKPEPYPDIRYSRFTYADVPRPQTGYPKEGYSQSHHTGMVLSRAPPQQFIAQPQPSPQPPRYGDYQHSPQPMRSYNPEPGYVSRQVEL